MNLRGPWGFVWHVWMDRVTLFEVKMTVATQHVFHSSKRGGEKEMRSETKCLCPLANSAWSESLYEIRVSFSNVNTMPSFLLSLCLDT